jgi:hypothetical protein
MADDLLPYPGSRTIRIEELRGNKARSFAKAVSKLPFVKLLSVRAFDNSPDREAVIFETEVERGQVVKHDIRQIEVLSVTFETNDQNFPEVEALRTDFPSVPHLNQRPHEFPRSLCIYEDVFAEYQLKWSPARFVEDIRNWLALTARGELHQSDQPLEPLLLGSRSNLVVPDSFFQGRGSGDALFLSAHSQGASNTYMTLIVDRIEDDAAKANVLAIYLKGVPQIHGVIRRTPQTFGDLNLFLEPSGIDLLTSLRAGIRSYLKRNTKRPDQTYLIIVADLPKTRTAGGGVENTDRLAFATGLSISEVGERLGVCERVNGVLGLGLLDDSSKTDLSGQVLQLTRLDVLTSESAAALNGVERFDHNSVIVGVGALGSQILNLFFRSGFGRWTIVDHDLFLPHNGARHALTGYTGINKAEGMTEWGRATLPAEAPANAILANILFPGKDGDRIEEAFRNARFILDSCASVAAARYLARVPFESPRVISAFVNPNASDLVVLSEPRDRSLRVDQLEMYYYRQLVRDARLTKHFQGILGARRYSNSCRDISAIVDGSLMSVAAAFATRLIRESEKSDQARIFLCSTDATTNSTQTHAIPVPRAATFEANGWTILTDEIIVEEIQAKRQSTLPNETGGVLVGTIDMQRRLIFVAEMIPSPPDSKEWPHLYIRGSAGLSARLREIAQRTQGGLEYVGEWHSHPRFHGVCQSGDDRIAMRKLRTIMAEDGRPAVMLIVGDSELGWYVEDPEF